MKSVSGEAIVTATKTTKQERYEKKMAKYLANKARKEQKKQSRREANHPSNGASEAATIAIVNLPILTENVDEWIEDFNRVGEYIIREYIKSDKPHFLGEVTIGGENSGYFGFVVWSEDGEDLTVTPFLESSANKVFIMLWEEFVRYFILELVSTYKSECFYQASSIEEAKRAMWRGLK